MKAPSERAPRVSTPVVHLETDMSAKINFYSEKNLLFRKILF